MLSGCVNIQWSSFPLQDEELPAHEVCNIFKKLAQSQAPPLPTSCPLPSSLPSPLLSPLPPPPPPQGDGVSPLNSDDDEDDSDGEGTHFDTEDTIVCQFEKVTQLFR